MNRAYVVGALLGASILVSPAARAADLHFNFLDTAGSQDFSFDLPSSTPTPDFYESGSNTIFDVSGTLNGAAGDFEVYFYNSSYSGGLSVDNFAEGGDFYFQNGFGQYNPLTNTYQQVYSGPEGAPTFFPGVYTLYAQDPATFESSGVPEGELTVSAAPEPSVWLLMMAGVAGVGFALRGAKTMAARRPRKLASAPH